MFLLGSRIRACYEAKASLLGNGLMPMTEKLSRSLFNFFFPVNFLLNAYNNNRTLGLLWILNK